MVKPVFVLLNNNNTDLILWGGEGNDNPLQCSCLENPKDGGAWWASVYGVILFKRSQEWVLPIEHLIVLDTFFLQQFSVIKTAKVMANLYWVLTVYGTALSSVHLFGCLLSWAPSRKSNHSHFRNEGTGREHYVNCLRPLMVKLGSEPQSDSLHVHFIMPVLFLVFWNTVI